VEAIAFNHPRREIVPCAVVVLLQIKMIHFPERQEEFEKDWRIGPQLPPLQYIVKEKKRVRGCLKGDDKSSQILSSLKFDI
jgi:hypothetical protein